MKSITTFTLGVWLLSSCGDVVSAVTRAAFGGKQATCESLIIQSACSVSWCQPNQRYHGDKAYECRQQFAEAECGRLDAATLTGNVASVLAAVSACAQVCTTDIAGSSPGG